MHPRRHAGRVAPRATGCRAACARRCAGRERDLEAAAEVRRAPPSARSRTRWDCRWPTTTPNCRRRLRVPPISRISPRWRHDFLDCHGSDLRGEESVRAGQGRGASASSSSARSTRCPSARNPDGLYYEQELNFKEIAAFEVSESRVCQPPRAGRSPAGCAPACASGSGGPARPARPSRFRDARARPPAPSGMLARAVARR